MNEEWTHVRNGHIGVNESNHLKYYNSQSYHNDVHEKKYKVLVYVSDQLLITLSLKRHLPVVT